MKQINFRYGTLKLACALCLLACTNLGKAQNLVLPNNPDNLWFNIWSPPFPAGPYQPMALNTAAIAYNDGVLHGPVEGLYASVVPTFTNVIPPCYNEIHVRDLFGMDVTAISGGAPYGFDSVGKGTDITIGNSDGTGGRNTCNDFILATSYANKAGNPTIDFYVVHRSPLSINYIKSYKYTPHTNAGTVRIDVIAEYGSLHACGNPLPWCRRFMLTWENAGSVYVAEGDLNLMTLTTPARLVGTGTEPDVAGVQRVVGPATKDVAYITFSNGLNRTEFSRWVVGALPSAPVPVDDGTFGSGSQQFPRIDAPDDFNLNPALVQYKIAVKAFDAANSNFEIRAYDNFNFMPGIAISDHDDFNLLGGCGAAHAGPYHNHQPYVSVFGVNDYAILHTSNSYVLPATDRNFLIAETIDNTSAGNSFWGNNYYKVNGVLCSDYDPRSADFRSSASPCPNDLSPQQPVIFAWSNFDPFTTSGGIYNIQYKFSNSVVPNFKTPNTTAVANVAPGDWSIYPNPADELLSVKSPEGTIVQAYDITDVTGRTVLKGTMSGRSTNINIRQLANGSYFIKLQNDKNEVKLTSFVKD